MLPGVGQGAAPPAIAKFPHALISTHLETPLGDMLACATDEGLCLLEFAGRRALPREIEEIERHYGTQPIEADHPHLTSIRSELTEYFAGERTRFGTPLALRGSSWERAVWGRLLAIPFGETRSYESIALALARPGAQRAVGLANGRNRIAIVVPCHRVIEKSGRLRGYGGGLRRKAFLLALERQSSGQTLF